MEPLRRGCRRGGGRKAGLALLSVAVALVVWGTAGGAMAPQGQQHLLSSRLGDAWAVGRQGAVGPRLQPWVHNRSCPVYIMDASKELAPHADVPQCDINDLEVGFCLVWDA